MNFLEEIEKIKLLFEQIKTDPTLMMIVAISVVITLVIVLIVVIFSSTIQTLKRNLFNEREFSKGKIKEVQKLTKEIVIYDKTVKEDKKELKKFEKIKMILSEREKEIKELKKDIKIKKNRISDLEYDLSDLVNRYNKSLNEIKAVKKRNEELIEEKRRK